MIHVIIIPVQPVVQEFASFVGDIKEDYTWHIFRGSGHRSTLMV